ncbi:MAG: phosphoribosylglycinamide formyltransferase [Spirochaetales bacterium]|nr:phosphoribosylglycinamide formyltransferase [Spirochaetales bacterium]
MANLAVFASGNGTNFEAIAKALAHTRHRIVCLIADKKDAFALVRAEKLGIPSHIVSYKDRTREDAEGEMLAVLAPLHIDYIALAGFMRLLGRRLIDAYPSRIINIHPALLPKYPGTRGIEESYHSGDRELGITIHYVDYGLDSGPVILQRSFTRGAGESVGEIERRIHELEHIWYPRVMIDILDTPGGDFSRNVYPRRGENAVEDAAENVAEDAAEYMAEDVKH